MKFIDGGVTAAKGFKAAGTHVGIKAANTTKKDMAMVYSECPKVFLEIQTLYLKKCC